MKMDWLASGNDRRTEVASRTVYSHLIGAASAGLKLASCLYFDGVQFAEVSMVAMLDLVEDWFGRHRGNPRVVVASRAAEPQAPRCSMKILREISNDRGALSQFKTLTFFPKGRTTIDDTWRPSVYFAVSIDQPTSAFFCFNESFEAGADLEYLRAGNGVFDSCAAYAFSFPERFSPLGYYWHFAVEPAGRDLGKWGSRESRRLSHHRDNALIGILSNGQRRFYNACDGYVRDVYPLMLLSDRHMQRSVGATTLVNAIREHRLGDITSEGDRYLWRVPIEKLAQAQVLLDDHEITLSGHRLGDPTSPRHLDA